MDATNEQTQQRRGNAPSGGDGGIRDLCLSSFKETAPFSAIQRHSAPALDARVDAAGRAPLPRPPMSVFIVTFVPIEYEERCRSVVEVFATLALAQAWIRRLPSRRQPEF